MLNMIRNEQLKFQSEMWSTFTGMQSHQTQIHIGDKPEGSANHIGSSSSAPNTGVNELFGSKNGKGWLFHHLIEVETGVMIFMEVMDEVQDREVDHVIGGTVNWICQFLTVMTLMDGY